MESPTPVGDSKKPTTKTTKTTAATTSNQTQIDALEARRAQLLAALPTAPTAADGEQGDSEKLALAQAVVQGHIKRLGEYNDVKDVAQGLIGILAERRGVRIVDVMAELGVESED